MIHIKKLHINKNVVLGSEYNTNSTYYMCNISHSVYQVVTL